MFEAFKYFIFLVKAALIDVDEQIKHREL